MKRLYKQILATALLVSASLPAMADVGDPTTSCDAGTVLANGTQSFLDCSGPASGNLLDSGVLAFNGVFGNTGNFAFAGKSAAGSGTGPFTAFSTTVSGTLTFLTKQVQSFVIGLETSDGVDASGSPLPDKLSYYLFTANPAGTTSVDFDTFGISVTQSFSSRELLVAALYTNPVPVPEPASLAFMLAGLGAFGFLVRRRAS